MRVGRAPQLRGRHPRRPRTAGTWVGDRGERVRRGGSLGPGGIAPGSRRGVAREERGANPRSSCASSSASLPHCSRSRLSGTSSPRHRPLRRSIGASSPLIWDRTPLADRRAGPGGSPLNIAVQRAGSTCAGFRPTIPRAHRRRSPSRNPPSLFAQHSRYRLEGVQRTGAARPRADSVKDIRRSGPETLGINSGDVSP